MPSTFPSVTANILSANVNQGVSRRSILIIGQKVSGTANSGQLIENIISEKEANDYFGRTSQIGKAIRSSLKAISISSERPSISAIGLTDNEDADAATASVVFSGTATSAGKIIVYIDDKNQGKYQIDVAVGDTASTIGARLVALIGLNLDARITAINTTGSVALTALNKGPQGNFIGLQTSGTVAGITLAINEFTGGATNPLLTSLFDPIVDKRYTTIVYPNNLDIEVLTDFTESRFNVDNKVLDGLGLVCIQDTYSNLDTTIGDLNQKTLATLPNNKVSTSTYKGGAIFIDPLSLAATIAGVREVRMTVGSNVSSITTNGLGTGGSFFAAIPYADTPYFDLPIIDSGNDFSDTEAKVLQDAGGWLLRNNPNNTVLISNLSVTTYKTNVLGQPDPTFTRVNRFDTLTIIREFFFNNLKKDGSQRILTTGNLIGGLPQINKDGFIALMSGYYAILSGMNGDSSYGLLRNSSEDLKAFKALLSSSTIIDLAAGKILANSTAPIVTQLETIIINFIPTFE